MAIHNNTDARTTCNTWEVCMYALIFLVGALLGTLAGGALCVRYLRHEVAADIGPRLRRIQIQLENLESAAIVGRCLPLLHGEGSGHTEHLRRVCPGVHKQGRSAHTCRHPRCYTWS